MRAFFATLLASLVLCGSAAAVDLRVDIGVTDDGVHTSVTPNDIQAAFSGFNVDPQFNGGGSEDFVTPGVIPVARTISGVNISIVGGSNGGFFYDLATEVSGPLGDLVEDGVFVFDGDLTVTMSGLPAGTYQMTNYHHQADLTQSVPAFNIFLNTGSGESQVATAVAVSTGFSSPAVTTSSFQFTATGANVVMRLDGAFVQDGPSIPVFLNGFTVLAVPEPSSVLLLALGVIPFALRRLLRKK